ncbi:MAG: toxin-antitoxin system YwqK family antitoxin [Putridiphycobacter sp.]|nr:toxin-antitoxin system YwqK family antitoxin [Putridiphycobacter sp.]
MKSLISFFSIISFAISGTAQGEIEKKPDQPIIKCTDARFERVKDCADVVYFDEDQNAVFHQKSGKPYTGFCKSCFFNDNLEMYLQFVNGRAEGQDTIYYEEGTINLIRSHYQGKEDGTWIFYNKDGTIKWEKSYYAGMAEGKHVYYFPDGNIYKIETWQAGQLTGVKKEFFEGKNGQPGTIKKEIGYKNGKFDGLYKTYFENGQVAIEQFFKEGEKDGQSSYYYDDGKLFYTENYKNGQREGQIKRLYQNGNTWIIERYKKGQKEGVWEEYYEDGTLKYEGKWEKNVLVEEHFYNADGDEIRKPGSEPDEKEEETDDKKKKKKK